MNEIFDKEPFQSKISPFIKELFETFYENREHLEIAKIDMNKWTTDDIEHIMFILHCMMCDHYEQSGGLEKQDAEDFFDDCDGMLDELIQVVKKHVKLPLFINKQ